VLRTPSAPRAAARCLFAFLRLQRRYLPAHLVLRARKTAPLSFRSLRVCFALHAHVHAHFTHHAACPRCAPSGEQRRLSGSEWNGAYQRIGFGMVAHCGAGMARRQWAAWQNGGVWQRQRNCRLLPARSARSLAIFCAYAAPCACRRRGVAAALAYQWLAGIISIVRHQYRTCTLPPRAAVCSMPRAGARLLRRAVNNIFCRRRARGKRRGSNVAR